MNYQLRPISVGKIVATLVSCVTFTFSTLGAVSAMSLGANSPVPNFASLQKQLTAALSSTRLPSQTVSSLGLISKGNWWKYTGNSMTLTSCNPLTNPAEAKNPRPCFYGNTRAKRTIVIFGDSMVGNWLPALDVFGRTANYRIADFSFQGCPVEDIASNWSAGGAMTSEEQAACILWHTTMPKSVAALNPVAIISTSIASSQASTNPGDSWYINGLQTEFDRMTSSMTTQPVKIIVQSTPLLPWNAPDCLARHIASANVCTLRYVKGQLGSGLYSSRLVRDSAAALQIGAQLLPANIWVCINGACPATLQGHLIYVDSDHISTWFSLYISKVFGQTLAPLLLG